MKKSRLKRSDPYEWQRRSAKRYEDKLRAEGHSRFPSIGSNPQRKAKRRVSKPKGFVAKVNHSTWVRDWSHDELGLHAPHGAARDIPVLSHVWVQPIEDESLPHPGDGKEWEDESGERVEVLRAPFPWNTSGVPGDEHLRVHCRLDTGHHVNLMVSSLRERKPEPEHKPWCERRSGEDRRQGERRERGGRRCTDIWSTASRDRRSHRDRRKS